MPEYLEQSIIDAKAGNYALGVKLVRGAYHVQENAVYEKHFEAQKKAGGDSGKGKVVTPSKNYFSEEPNPPVWSTKAETDLCYNTCVKMLIGSVAQDVDALRSGDTQGSWHRSRKHKGCPVDALNMV